MSTYIAIATADELALVRKHEEMEGIPVIITGVGGCNVINALSNLPKDSFIINIGYAGSPDLEIGREYNVGVVQLLHEVEYSDQVYFCGYGVDCYTSTDFVKVTDRKGCLFDMELAFICALGFKSVRALKTVSDHCNYEEYERNIH